MSFANSPEVFNSTFAITSSEKDSFILKLNDGKLYSVCWNSNNLQVMNDRISATRCKVRQNQYTIWEKLDE